MNPLYNMLMGHGMPQQIAPNQMSPFQKVSMAMQAMQNPAKFVKQAIPDLPDEIANDPNRILNYLQQTRGVTNQDIQQIMQQVPKF